MQNIHLGLNSKTLYISLRGTYCDIVKGSRLYHKGGVPNRIIILPCFFDMQGTLCRSRDRLGVIGFNIATAKSCQYPTRQYTEKYVKASACIKVGLAFISHYLAMGKHHHFKTNKGFRFKYKQLHRLISKAQHHTVFVSVDIMKCRLRIHTHT